MTVLPHQDENFYNANLGTCMDYTVDWSTNQSPNQHDYDQLASIYAHGDGFGTAPQQGATAGVTRIKTALFSYVSFICAIPWLM